MQTSLRRRHRDRVVRRGLALIIESDFYATDAGRQHFADQLTSIRYCVQETCNFDVLHAYLSSTNYDMTWDFRKGLRNKRNIKQAMNHGDRRPRCPLRPAHLRRAWRLLWLTALPTSQRSCCTASARRSKWASTNASRCRCLGRSGTLRLSQRG